MIETDTLIIGGGLAGLSIAAQLDAQNHDFQLIEARNRLGGRILTKTVSGGDFDLGPAWFWHGQPRIAALIQQLGLPVFEQYAAGDQMFEDQRGNVQRRRGFAAMQGSLRLEGGLGRLIDAVSSSLPQDRLHLSTPAISVVDDISTVTVHTATNQSFKASRVVLALPPRVAATLTFAPNLSDQIVSTLTEIPTWMGGQAKVVAVYETAFWRNTGLSGDGNSQHGPMIEIHDASPATGGPPALFGFIGIPASHRTDEIALKDHVKAQLVRLFGTDAAAPVDILLKDWAFDPQTSTEQDLRPSPLWNAKGA